MHVRDVRFLAENLQRERDESRREAEKARKKASQQIRRMREKHQEEAAAQLKTMRALLKDQLPKDTLEKEAVRLHLEALDETNAADLNPAARQVIVAASYLISQASIAKERQSAAEEGRESHWRALKMMEKEKDELDQRGEEHKVINASAQQEETRPEDSFRAFLNSLPADDGMVHAPAGAKPKPPRGADIQGYFGYA